MGEAFIKSLADQIAAAYVSKTWVTFALLIALTAVVNFAAGYLGAYARKRGETLATKADFDELKEQLAETTRIAEAVKVSLAHEDWITREWKTLRRIKLEELIKELHDVMQWLTDEQRRRLVTMEDSPPSPLPNVQRLVGLYFPEFSPLIGPFSVRQSEMQMALLDTQVALRRTSPGSEDWLAAHNIQRTLWQRDYPAQLADFARIEAAAGALMKELMNVQASVISTV